MRPLPRTRALFGACAEVAEASASSRSSSYNCDPVGPSAYAGQILYPPSGLRPTCTSETAGGSALMERRAHRAGGIDPQRSRVARWPSCSTRTALSHSPTRAPVRAAHGGCVDTRPFVLEIVKDGSTVPVSLPWPGTRARSPRSRRSGCESRTSSSSSSAASGTCSRSRASVRRAILHLGSSRSCSSTPRTSRPSRLPSTPAPSRPSHASAASTTSRLPSATPSSRPSTSRTAAARARPAHIPWTAPATSSRGASARSCSSSLRGARTSGSHGTSGWPSRRSSFT